MPELTSTAGSDRRHWRFALLYFSEGAPIGFLWWALPTLLRAEGVAVERITALTATLVLPWTLKFLWAPLVDAWRGPRWGFRHWAMAAQLGMGLALLPLTMIDPADGFAWWVGLLLLHAVCASTQDVAIDALAVASVAATGRGRLNAAMQIGMLAGRSLFGGGAIVLASRGGWPLVMGALVVAVWGSLVVLLTQVAEPARVAGESRRQFWSTLRAVLARRPTWLGLGFALLAGAGFEAAGALAGPLLIDRGVGEQTTGFFFALPVVALMAVGGWVGGRWADGGSRRHRVAAMLAAVTASVALLGAAIWLGTGGTGAMVMLGAVYLAIGGFTAASYALFMDLTDRRLGATQFSTFMAATNGCEAWAVALAGVVVSAAGYGPALLLMAGLGLIAVALLPALKHDGG